MDQDSKNLNKVSTKQNMLKQKLEECQSKISDLGALPNTELITKFMSYSSKNVRLILNLLTSFIKFYKMLTLIWCMFYSNF